jgi:hypothetical protein
MNSYSEPGSVVSGLGHGSVVGSSQYTEMTRKESCFMGNNRAQRLNFGIKNALLRRRYPRGGKAIVAYSYDFGVKNSALSSQNTYLEDLY